MPAVVKRKTQTERVRKKERRDKQREKEREGEGMRKGEREQKKKKKDKISTRKILQERSRNITQGEITVWTYFPRYRLAKLTSLFQLK